MINLNNLKVFGNLLLNKIKKISFKKDCYFTNKLYQKINLAKIF